MQRTEVQRAHCGAHLFFQKTEKKLICNLKGEKTSWKGASKKRRQNIQVSGLVLLNLNKSEMSSIQRLTTNNQQFNCVIIREVCGERPSLGSRFPLYFFSCRGLMEFIQLGEPLVETNKKFFRLFLVLSFTLLFHPSSK